MASGFAESRLEAGEALRLKVSMPLNVWKVGW